MHVCDTFGTIGHCYAIVPGLHNTEEYACYGTRYISDSDLKGVLNTYVLVYRDSEEDSRHDGRRAVLSLVSQL
jgi:hypothetical protein